MRNPADTTICSQQANIGLLPETSKYYDGHEDLKPDLPLNPKHGFWNFVFRVVFKCFMPLHRFLMKIPSFRLRFLKRLFCWYVFFFKQTVFIQYFNFPPYGWAGDISKRLLFLQFPEKVGLLIFWLWKMTRLIHVRVCDFWNYFYMYTTFFVVNSTQANLQLTPKAKQMLTLCNRGLKEL